MIRRFIADHKVCEARESTPKNDCSWWWVVAAGEVAAKPCDGCQIKVQIVRCVALNWCPATLEEHHLSVGEDSGRRALWLSSLEPCQPRNAPGSYTCKCNAIGKAVSSCEPDVFYSTSRL